MRNSTGNPARWKAAVVPNSALYKLGDKVRYHKRRRRDAAFVE
jgi:hypothetical protein